MSAKPLVLIPIKLIGALPLRVRIIIGRTIGAIISILPLRETRIAKKQLEFMLGIKAPYSTIRKMYSNIGQTVMESLNLKPYLKKLDTHIECKSNELIEKLIAENKPIIALTAHTANWDLLAAYMVQKGVPLSTIGRRARKKSLQTILEFVRDSYGIRTLWREKHGGTKDVISELKQRRTIAALIDQDTRVTSTYSQLLKLPAKTPTGLLALGKRYGSVIVTAFIIRTAFDKYSIEVETIDSELSIDEIIDVYHQRFSKILTNTPEQWVWFHKRWRSQPEQNTMSTKEYLKYLQRKILHSHD